jgi:hypothetical protein
VPAAELHAAADAVAVEPELLLIAENHDCNSDVLAFCLRFCTFHHIARRSSIHFSLHDFAHKF